MAINKRINAKNSQISVKKTKVNRNDRYNVDALKERLKDDGTALDVFTLAGVPSELVEYARQTGRERGAGAPCPICGGVDRFKLVRPKDGGAGWLAFCRQCSAGGRSYSPLDFYMTARRLDLNAAVREIVDALDGSNVNAMRMTKNDVVIQSAPPIRQTAPASIMAKPSARITATTAPETSKKGLRVVPESEARQETRDYIYTDENGASVFNAQRVDFYDRTTGERVAIDRDGATVDKSILSLVPNGAGGWKPSNGLDRSTIPPYNLPKLKKPACQCVYIVEGEKSAERLERALAGYDGERVATTTGATSNAGHWRQWAPRVLSGKGVFVLADHDAPGRKAAETIAEAAAPLAAGNVQIIDFETRPDGTPAPAGYDVADYLDDLERVDPSAIASNYLDALAVPFTPSAFPLQRKTDGAPIMANAEELDADEELNRAAIAARLERENEREREKLLDEIALANDAPFPVDLLPSCLFGYVMQLSNKFHLPPESVALGALSLVGSFAGYKFKLQSPEIGYDELFPKTCVLGVAKSGSFKTPLFDFLTAPIKKIEDRGKEQYQTALKVAKRLQNEIRLAKSELKKVDAKIKRRKASGNEKDLDYLERRARELESTIDLEESDEAQLPPPPPLFLLKPKSPEGIKRTICNNLKVGCLNGAFIGTSEGISIFNMAGGADRLLDRIAQLSEIIDGDEFNEITITSHGVGEEYLPGKKFAGALLYIQPAPFARCLKNPDIRAQGFINRLIKIYIPHARDVATLDKINRAAKDPYFLIFDWLERIEGGLFTLSAEAVDAFQRWRIENQEAKNAAEDRGDDDEKAFLNKLEQVCLCYVQSLRICDFLDGAPGTIDQSGKIRLDIDGATMERALTITKAAAKVTAVCARILAREMEKERDDAPRYVAKKSDLERRALELIAEAGTDGASIKDLRKTLNAFRDYNTKTGRHEGGKLARLILERLRNAGEIEKHGARYYVAAMPEPLDDQEGGAE